MDVEDRPTIELDPARSRPTATTPATVTGDTPAAETSAIVACDFFVAVTVTFRLL